MVERTPPGVVVGVDGSAAAVAALHWAVEQARRTGDRVTAIAVWKRVPVLAAGFAPEAVGGLAVAAQASDQPELQARAEAWLDDAVADLPAGSDQLIDRLVVPGDAAAVLIEAAEAAEMLVLGNHGRGALAGAMLGSVVHRCVPDVRCPLVLVPGPSTPDAPDGS